MSYIVICSVACLASLLTFFSGFGLGTLLLPAFAIFFPVEQAVTLTAVVHFLNGLFKIGITGHSISWTITRKFGISAIAGGIAGAIVLEYLSDLEPILSFRWIEQTFVITPVKMVIGVLLISFALLDIVPTFRDITFGPQWIFFGGMLSGFFGGLAGMQGALRSAFLSRAGLTKEEFVATAAIIAVLVDLSRLGVYARSVWRQFENLDHMLLVSVILAAWFGAVLGKKILHSITMESIRNFVALLLVLVGSSLVTGLL